VRGKENISKVVYYESIKREVQTDKTICECRCDERLKTKVEESTRLAYKPRLLGDLEHQKWVSVYDFAIPVQNTGGAGQE
jgi:hypothetical protein